MTEAEKHLSIEQFDLLLEARNQALNPVSGAQAEPVNDANRHLLNCKRCRTVLSLLELWDRLPKEEKETRPEPRTSACPSETAVLELAAGISSEPEADALLEHIAACGHCGPLLQQASGWFADEFSTEEEEAIATLSTASPERQAAIASEISASLAATPPTTKAPAREEPSVRFWSFAPRLAWSFAAALVLVVAGVFIWRTTRGPDVNQLLAQAYTEHRTFELRFAGADYSPTRRDRATAGSLIDRPQALLDADALIARRLKSDPRDFAWRQAKARADLLEWDFEDAIQNLRQLQKEKANSLAIKQDLAAAYFERAEATAQPSDYGAAAELFGEILKQDPKNPIALFNRAVVYERLLLYHEALNDWHTYLSVDDKSPWAGEAKARACEIQKRLGSSENERNRPLLSVHEIATATENDSVETALDEHVEDYLNIATGEWLPRILSSQNTGTEPHEMQVALLRLSHVLATKHKDNWLLDVLATRPFRPSASGAADLAQAIALVDRGRYSAAERVAARSERRLQNSGSGALIARADLERLIALDRTFEGKACRQLQSAIERRIEGLSYVWIQTQLLLESAVCSASGGNLQAAYNTSRRARELASSAGFHHLYLRAQGFVAEYDTDQNRAFLSNVEGLRVFWQQDSNPFRGHQFFEALAMLAENRANWQLATAFNREAVLAIKGTPRRPLEATARLYLGRAQYQAGFRKEAASEWQLALQSLDSLPADDSITAILTELHVNLAKSALDEARVSDASRELDAAAPRFLHPGLHEVSIQYFSLLARLYSLEGQQEEANKAWQEAVARTEVEIRNAASPFDRVRLAELCEECFVTLARLRLERNDAIGALTILEQYRSVGLRGTRSVRRLDETRAFQQHLPDEAAMLSAVELQDGLAVWLVSRKEIGFRHLTLPVSQFRDTASRFAAECSDRTSSLAGLRRDGAQLYRWLVLPFESQLASTRLLILERGQPSSLSAIPFEALVREDGRYLAQDYSVAYVEGIEYLDPSSTTPENFFLERALVIAGPSPSTQGGASRLIPLPDALKEAREISARFRHATVFEGPQATSEVLRREIAQTTVFHFAGHASATPGRTGLLISATDGTEGFTFGPENSSDHLANLRLVFLSACSTAKSGDEDSPDLAGLAQTYRLAGSRVVLGNKWAVDSAASKSFALAFYAELAAGSSIPTAVRRAEARLRTSAGFEHPYFWSAPTLLL